MYHHNKTVTSFIRLGLMLSLLGGASVLLTKHATVQRPIPGRTVINPDGTITKFEADKTFETGGAKGTTRDKEGRIVAEEYFDAKGTTRKLVTAKYSGGKRSERHTQIYSPAHSLVGEEHLFYDRSGNLSRGYGYDLVNGSKIEKAYDERTRKWQTFGPGLIIRGQSGTTVTSGGTNGVIREEGLPLPNLPGLRPTEKTQPDGTIVRTWDNGNIELIYPDGTTVLVKPDGTIVITFPDGTKTTVGNASDTSVSRADGSVLDITRDRLVLPAGWVTVVKTIVKYRDKNGKERCVVIREKDIYPC